MRQVYFDPYGSYTQGLDSGMARQLQLETQRRENRLADFNYNYRLPLKYNEEQRNDQLGEYALPYEKNAIQQANELGEDRVTNSAFNTGMSVADVFPGVSQALANMVGSRYGIHYVPDQNDPTKTHVFMQGPDGQLHYMGTPTGDIGSAAYNLAVGNRMMARLPVMGQYQYMTGRGNYYGMRGQEYAPGGFMPQMYGYKDMLMEAEAQRQRALAAEAASRAAAAGTNGMGGQPTDWHSWSTRPISPSGGLSPSGGQSQYNMPQTSSPPR